MYYINTCIYSIVGPFRGGYSFSGNTIIAKIRKFNRSRTEEPRIPFVYLIGQLFRFLSAELNKILQRDRITIFYCFYSQKLKGQ